jgi:Domain of unknown function (DUF4124)
MRPVRLVFVICALAATVPANAQVYRWVDDRGVVNYASKPPGDGRPRVRIDHLESRISVIPIAPRASSTPLPPGAALPQAQRTFPGMVDQATLGSLSPDVRARCIAERRVDCDSPTAATFDVVPSIAQTAPAGFGPWFVR